MRVLPGCIALLATGAKAFTFVPSTTTRRASSQLSLLSATATAEAKDVETRKGMMALRLASSTTTKEAPSAVKTEDNATLMATIKEKFPGAMSASEFTALLSAELAAEVNDKKENILLCTSLCADELNREFEGSLRAEYGSTFNLGGLAGFPFAGITGFSAMAAHIPDGGSTCLVFGPHVGVNYDGEVGTVERSGKENGGTCCGSAIAAKGYVLDAMKAGKRDAIIPQSFIDAQQTFVGNELMKHGERLVAADDEMVELPLALFDSQNAAIENILEVASERVAGEGKIAVIGGVQINTPPGEEEYFLPKVMQIRSNKNKVLKDFLPKPDNTTLMATIKQKFPGAIPASKLASTLDSVISSKVNDKKENILLCTSLCADELNREFEGSLTSLYGSTFNLGGLAGFPFAGITGFSAMSAHIPDGGSTCLVFGPHVGVNYDGEVGTVERSGKENGGTCCGSAIAAKGFVMEAMKADKQETITPDGFIDAQQTFVGNELLKHGERLVAADDEMVELPLALFDSQNAAVESILEVASSRVAGEGKIVVVGGVQINTPPGEEEYFLPKVAQIRSNENELVEDFLTQL